VNATPAEAVKATMIAYLIKHAGIAPEALAKGDAKLDSLDVDSLSTVEMLWELEETYGVHIDDVGALKDMTLDQMAQLIGSQVSVQA
jgi:acyl carrier protein